MILERILARRLGLPLPRPSELEPPGARQRPVVSLWIEAAGVLYDDTYWWRWLAQLISHAGVHVSHDSLHQAWECEFLRALGTGCPDIWLALRRCLVRLGLSRAFCDEVQAAAAAQQKLAENGMHPLPGAKKALADLSRCGVSLIALASVGCPAPRLAERLRLLALARSFERFIGLEDRDHPPTACDFYLELAASLRLSPAQTAMISNKPHHLVAARTAGLVTVGIGCGEAEADLHLDLLAGLPCWLRGNCGRPLAA